MPYLPYERATPETTLLSALRPPSLRRDFRHEKTKKKRGSYRGGAIDPHATFSTKFESDDDE